MVPSGSPTAAYELHHGDALEVLRTMPDASVHCCITSPPYYGLRDYGVEGQIGLEPTPEEFIAKLVDVFREVRRVLRDDGTLWVNMGDSYAGSWSAQGRHGKTGDLAGRSGNYQRQIAAAAKRSSHTGSIPRESGLKPKDLMGMPWALAFALRQPYVDWRIKTEAMRAWVAGIVDGEGCITILKTKSAHSESLSFPPIIQVRMTDTAPLDRLVEVAGSKYSAPQSPPSHNGKQRDSYQWKVVSAAAARIITEIYPFLTCKRKQAVVAYNHQLFRSGRGNQERKSGDIEREIFCKDLIQKLNRREPVDLPSWMVEPKVQETPGWYLRQDCIWHKPNPMPESVKDRCTKAHEYVFLLSKAQRYWYDADAIKERSSENTHPRLPGNKSHKGATAYESGDEKHRTAVGLVAYADKMRKLAAPGSGTKNNSSFDAAMAVMPNKRSVWSIVSMPTPEAHFATFPLELPELCMKAGCPEGGVVLDPFAGAGTTGLACLKNGREFVGIELNPAYIEIAKQRAQKYYPLLCQG